jgi:hypothetical protein
MKHPGGNAPLVPSPDNINAAEYRLLAQAMDKTRIDI